MIAPIKYQTTRSDIVAFLSILVVTSGSLAGLVIFPSGLLDAY